MYSPVLQNFGLVCGAHSISFSILKSVIIDLFVSRQSFNRESWCTRESKLMSFLLFSLLHLLFIVFLYLLLLFPMSQLGDPIANKLPTVTYTLALAWLNWPLPLHLLKASVCWAGCLSCLCVLERGTLCVWAHGHGVYHCHLCLKVWHQQDKEVNEGCRGTSDTPLASCGEFQVMRCRREIIWRRDSWAGISLWWALLWQWLHGRFRA